VRRCGPSIRMCRSQASTRSVIFIPNRMARTSFTLVMLAVAGGHGACCLESWDLRRGSPIPSRSALARLAFAWRSARSGKRSSRCSFATDCCLPASAFACGLVASFAVMRLMSSLLFNVSPLDPVTYSAGDVVCVVVTAYLAC